jgi:hypothetical protein
VNRALWLWGDGIQVVEVGADHAEVREISFREKDEIWAKEVVEVEGRKDVRGVVAHGDQLRGQSNQAAQEGGSEEHTEVKILNHQVISFAERVNCRET